MVFLKTYSSMTKSLLAHHDKLMDRTSNAGTGNILHLKLVC